MPELPEVEVVRCGLEAHLLGRQIVSAQARTLRSVRRHVAGPHDFEARVAGATVTAVNRRGKFLWLPLDSGDVLLAHLGMSGQLLLVDPSSPEQKHLRVLMELHDSPVQLRFVDQRTFGGLWLEPDGPDGPHSLAHIARDPLDPAFDDRRFAAAIRAKRSEVKRALLDQTLISGIGNIYADEALWRVGLHGERPTAALTTGQVWRLLAAVREVMGQALAQGGTSFDALYVNVNGQSGYFDRSLNAYGRQGLPCARCGSAIQRIAFANRSSYFCPVCQPRPREWRTSRS